MTKQNKQVEISSAIYNILTSSGVDQDFKEKIAKELGIEIPKTTWDDKNMDSDFQREQKDNEQEIINNSDIK